MTSPVQTSEAALAYVDKHRERFLEELKALLRIPSISTLPKHKKDVKRAAQYVADQMEAIGLNKVKVIKTALHPLVYGEWLEAEGRPTVLFYGHYDVQPVDPREQWLSDPFEPEVRNDNLYARGAVDDKGQMFALLKALEALMRTNDGKLPVNVKLLIEGEEEYGGESIEAYVKEHSKKLTADLALIADTGMPAPNVPAITYGLRGIIYTEIKARGAKTDLHSGEFGGVAPNPLQALAWVLATLKGPDGRIDIPELYEHLPEITADERALWDRSPIDAAATFKKEMGLDVLPGEQDYDPRERTGARPTLEVHGIVGGFTGDGAKTVIPAEASAKVSLRLPPTYEPEEALRWLQKRVARLSYPGITLTVAEVHGGKGMLVPVDNIYMRAAEKALEQEWGTPPVFERTGGSIPIAALFDSVLHTPVIMTGTGLPDDNMHAPNEKYSLPNFYHLIRQTVRYLDILGGDLALVARPATLATKANGNGTAPRRKTSTRSSGTTKASGSTTRAKGNGA